MTMLTLIYVIATLIIILVMAHANRLSNKSITTILKIEEQRIRPSVILEIFTEFTILNLRVKNIGLSTAFSIKIDSEPILKMCRGGKHVVPSEEIEQDITFVKNGIPSLAPGAEIKTIIGTYSRCKEYYKKLIFKGELVYKNSDSRTFTEPFHIDLTINDDLSNISKKGIHDIAKELKEIRDLIRLTATGFHKPIIRNIDEEQYQKKQMKELVEAQKTIEKMKTQNAKKKSKRKKKI